MNDTRSPAQGDEPGNGPSPSWEELLSSADAPDKLVALANEYLARLTTVEALMLPADCLPRRLLSAADVNEYAFDLKCCESDARARALVERLGSFFQDVCHRLANLADQRRREMSERWDKLTRD